MKPDHFKHRKLGLRSCFSCEFRQYEAGESTCGKHGFPLSEDEVNLYECKDYKLCLNVNVSLSSEGKMPAIKNTSTEDRLTEGLLKISDALLRLADVIESRLPPR